MTTAVQVYKAQQCIKKAKRTMLSMFQAEDIAIHQRGDSYNKYSLLAHKGRLEVKKQLKYARELLEV